MKVLVSTVTGLVIICVLGAVLIGSLFWSRLPDMLSSHLSEKLNVAVSIHSIRAGWNEVDLNKIQIANIPHSVLTHAFTCQKISVDAPLSHYFKQDIIIDEVELNAVYLGLEFDSASGTQGNWTRILGDTQGDSPKHHHKKKNKQVSPPPPSTPGRTLLIRKLVLTDIDTEVVYLKEGGSIKKLPRIPRLELTNISSEGGFPLDQLMNSVLGSMLKEVFIKQNLNNMLQEFLKPSSPVRDALLKGLFQALPPPQPAELTPLMQDTEGAI